MLTTPTTLALLHPIDVFFPILLVYSDGWCSWKAQPTPPLIACAQAETAIAVPRVIEIPSHIAVVVHGRSDSSHSVLALFFFELLLLLFDQLAGDNTEDLIYTFTIFGADLMTTVPAQILSPEAARSVTLWRCHTAGVEGCRYRAPAACLSTVWRPILRRVEIFGDVFNAALKRHFSLGRVFGYDI